MATLTENINLFQPTGFKLIINRKNFPNLQFFAQSVSHPAVTLNAAELPFPRVQSVPQPGDTITYTELNAMILLDEDFNSYTEMYNWMLRLVQSNHVSPYDATLGDGIAPTTHDITVTALTSHNNLNKTIKYIDAFPTSVGDVQFEATNSGVEYIVFPVSFRYTYFILE